jgi:hypothetical protein
MKLEQIEKRSGLTREEFIENYLIPSKPVVFKDLVADWPATQKWTFDYLKQKYGHISVPLFGNDFHKPGKDYMKPKMHKPFGDYLDMIQAGPTELRMFLFNIFKHAPELVHDVKTPTIMDGFVKEYPFMFFGGKDAVVNLHYDIDCSSVFLSQFLTRKRVILFAPDQSRYLYQHPFTVQAPVNVLKPDYEKHPAFRNAQGYDTIIEHGETVFIPSTFWHFIHYVDGGFGIALRANNNVSTQLRGLWNISRHFVVDKGMNLALGAKWKSWKEHIAERRAMEALQIA